jgi:hypothetical protein
MKWEKLGRVYAPDGSVPWMTSHAYVPTPYALDHDTIRVYVAFLDTERIGRVGLVDVAAEDPRHVLRVSERPALDVGAEGAFDEHGVTPSSVVTDRDTVWLYYFGWQRMPNLPYLLFAGLAASADGGESFTRVSSSPILPPVEGERVCRSAPAVLREEDAWRTWYVAGDAWTEVAGRLVPTYEIRTATSPDGIRWEGPGTTAVALAGHDEFGLGRPFVRVAGDRYELWYSVRTRARTYRIGFATSRDGVSWTRRDDEAGIDVSEEGWDCEMICFGSVLVTRYGTYLFYNGNDYGRTGFGVAREARARLAR